MDLDQKGREFVPHVLPVRVGTPVFFPNSDDIQHHVYSFSPAKSFEIKLYSGTPVEPIVFDRPGVVAIGCNIHDWMLAYVHVTESPYHASTDTEGVWALNLPDGNYTVEVWHPDALAPGELPRVTMSTAGAVPARYSIALKTRRRTGKPPTNLQDQGYSDGF
jgi:hypothetical protein